jgi:hypothetical protein
MATLTDIRKAARTVSRDRGSKICFHLVPPVALRKGKCGKIVHAVLLCDTGRKDDPLNGVYVEGYVDRTGWMSAEDFVIC